MMPKRFRDRLVALEDKKVWITVALDTPRHLDVLPDSAFKAFYAEVSARTPDKTLIAFKRFYFGSAIEVEVDAAGRILVPASLRKVCGLSDKISFVGVDERKFELWDPTALDAQFEELTANSDAILASLGGGGV